MGSQPEEAAIDVDEMGAESLGRLPGLNSWRMIVLNDLNGRLAQDRV